MQEPLWHTVDIMNRLTAAARAQVISCLVEGCSIRSTVRVAGVSKKAVMRLLVDVGAVCAEYQDRVFRNLKSRRVQVDEIWSWIECKARNVTPKIQARNPYAGDVWLWVALDADTKLVLAHRVGDRTPPMAYDFMKDVASRLASRVQLSTDGLYWYVDAVDNAFGIDVDYAMIQKHYAGGLLGERTSAARYSPTKFKGSTKEVIKGDPDPRHISTSFVERQNWTVRTNMRRYTRLSNGFSRKLENHEAAVALNYFVYNFIRIHRTLRVTPAIAAGVTTKLWEVSDLVALLEASESKKAA
jgi:IS1 family transposase